jgi:hypothetical protein
MQARTNREPGMTLLIVYNPKQEKKVTEIPAIFVKCPYITEWGGGAERWRM